MARRKLSKREMLREQRLKKERRKRLNIILALVIGGVIVIGLVAYPSIKSAVTPVGDFVEIIPEDWPDPNGTSLGDPDAKVVIEIFEDFKCIACKEYSDSVEPSVIANHVANGDVYYVFYQYPFLDDSRAIKDSDKAAAASMCAAEQNQFWDYHKILFTNFNSDPGEFNDKRLVAFAESLELDIPEFEKCFDENRYKDQINEDQALGVKRGITGTPSVFINGGQITPGYIPSYAQIQAAIEQELAN